MNTVRMTNDYLIYFDNVRMDHIVTSFSTRHTKDAGMPSASISIQINLGKNMSKNDYDAEYERYRDDIYKLRNVIKFGTNVFVFIKNVVSEKYGCVFNGTIQDIFVTTSRSRRSLTLEVSCIGSIKFLHELEALLSVPFEDITSKSLSPTAFKLQARTLIVDEESTAFVQSKKDISPDKMTIEEVLSRTSDAIKATNRLYMSDQSIQNFNAILDRIDVYSDIKEELLTNSILDYGIVTDSLVMETIYIRLAKQLSNMMLEFYESPSGEIIIKAPYWNAPVLYNHIIADIAIISENFAHRWSQRVSRTIVQGEISFDKYRESQIYGAQFAMPMAAYTEYEDGTPILAALDNGLYNAAGITNSQWLSASGLPIYTGDEVGSSFLDSLLIGSSKSTIKDEVSGTWIAYRTSSRQSIYYSGPKATVVSVGKNTLISNVSIYKGSTEDVVLLQIAGGIYEGCYLLYGGVTSIQVDVGEVISDGTLLGKAENWSGESTSVYATYTSLPNIFIRGLYDDYEWAISEGLLTNRIYLNPKVILRDHYSGKKSPTTASIAEMSVGEFGYPTDLEMMYGVSVSEEMQPIIKFEDVIGDYDNTGVTPDELAKRTLRKYAAYRHKVINANVSTMSLSLMPMPWLRPGFNTWIDPTGINEVYYIDSVSHSGSSSGVYTNVSVSMGRSAEDFFEGYTGEEETFGAINSKGTYGSNVFISEEKIAFADKFVNYDYVKSQASVNGYTDTMNKFINFKSKGVQSYNLPDEPFLNKLYNSGPAGVSGDFTPSNMGDVDFDNEMTAENIQTVLSYLFNNTSSEFIKSRSTALKLFVGELDETWERSVVD